MFVSDERLLELRPAPFDRLRFVFSRLKVRFPDITCLCGRVVTMYLCYLLMSTWPRLLRASDALHPGSLFPSR